MISSDGYMDTLMSETVTNGFFSVDRNWTVKWWNKAAENIVGLSSNKVIGKNFWEALGDIIPVTFLKTYRESVLQDAPRHFREYWKEKGEWLSAFTYYSDNTLSVSFQCGGSLVDPGKQLKGRNELYQFVTEVTNDCLWEWDFGRKELFWIDGGHKRIFGYQIEDALIPQSFWENRIHPDDKPLILEQLDKLIKGGIIGKWEMEYRFRKADGAYIYVHDRGHIVYGNDKKAVRMIGATQDINERKLTEMKLLESERKLGRERLERQTELTVAVLSAQEAERSNIGKELHDNLNQILGAAKLYVEMAKWDEENRGILLDKSSNYLVEVIEEIRNISKLLVTPDMLVLSLFDRIRILLDDMTAIDPIQIDFQHPGIEKGDLDTKLQVDIFRIIQEQLTNILKHSGATRATVVLTKAVDQVSLLITDNGKGSDLLKEKQGLGIVNIRSRAERHHGVVAIVSRPGEGYQLNVTMLNSTFRQGQKTP